MTDMLQTSEHVAQTLCLRGAANQKVVCFKWEGLEDELRSCTKNREKINEELRLIQSTSSRVQE